MAKGEVVDSKIGEAKEAETVRAEKADLNRANEKIRRQREIEKIEKRRKWVRMLGYPLRGIGSLFVIQTYVNFISKFEDLFMTLFLNLQVIGILFGLIYISYMIIMVREFNSLNVFKMVSAVVLILLCWVIQHNNPPIKGDTAEIIKRKHEEEDED
jgi:hypothetical protein